MQLGQTQESSTNLLIWALGWLDDGPRNGSQVGKHARACGLERSSGNPDLKNKTRILHVPDASPSSSDSSTAASVWGSPGLINDVCWRVEKAKPWATRVKLLQIMPEPS